MSDSSIACMIGFDVSCVLHVQYFHIRQLSGSCLAAFWSADSLTSLNLEGNYIGHEGAKAIADMLSANGSLTELDLRYNNLDESANAALRTAARPALNLRL